MKRTTKILTAVAGIAMATMIGLGAYVARAGALEATPARGRIAEKLAQLGVTDQQKAEVKDILRKYQPTVGPMVHQLVEARRTLRDTIRAETINEPAIRAQEAKVASLEADLAVQRAHVAQEVRAVLTPEQIAKWHDMQVNADARVDGFLHRVAKRISED